MINRRADITNYLGRTFFIVLFFFLLVTFSNQSVKQASFPVKIQSIIESQTTSVIADAIQIPLFQKNWVSSVDKLSFQHFNTTFKRYADDRIITQRFLYLQQNELLIKPLTHDRFYYHFFSNDIGEVPVLG